MSRYFNTPFPFHEIIQKSGRIPKLDLQDSIRTNIKTLILVHVGEFAYDRKLGFEMWDYDKHVFYYDKAPYYQKQELKKGMLEDGKARKNFHESLYNLISKNELRLALKVVDFGFEKVEGNMSVYQRKIVIRVEGDLISTNQPLSPAFRMSILYTPFKVETN